MESQGLARIPVDAPTRGPSGQTCAYVVGSTDGLLVDPAAVNEDLTTVVQQREVGHVAVTHHHPDHVGAVTDYADEFGLTVWCRYGRTAGFEAATGVTPDRSFFPGQTIPAGGGVTIVDTPGHAPEHVAFQTGANLLTGDLVLESGSVVVGAPEGDMRAYLASLRRVYARNPAVLAPAHGPMAETPRATCRRLLAHRRRREQRVRKAVLDGAHSPDEVVEAAYDKDVSAVFALARATVVAHLEKLAVEGDITWDGQRARSA